METGSAASRLQCGLVVLVFVGLMIFFGLAGFVAGALNLGSLFDLTPYQPWIYAFGLVIGIVLFFYGLWLLCAPLFFRTPVEKTGGGGSAQSPRPLPWPGPKGIGLFLLLVGLFMIVLEGSSLLMTK